jgi:alkanesulfonate monooxygenase SsuD/methylene tetrahydromethanopterin reductase-like flavin-dependent oxidoreductase (luciferase family)
MERGVACSFRVDEGSLLSAIESAAVAAEESGLASWWAVGDREQAADGSHDGVLGLQCVARVTRTLRLGLGGDILAAHNLGVRAKQLASLDWFSGGRLEHGLDLGELPAALRGVFPPEPEAGLAGSAELLGAMRALWTSRRATYAGQHIAFAGAIALPKPVGDRFLATHVRHDVSLGDAWGRIDDIVGWMTWGTSPAEIGLALDELDAALAEHGRPSVAVRRTWFVPADEAATAWEHAGGLDGRIDEIVAVFDRVPSPAQIDDIAQRTAA